MNRRNVVRLKVGGAVAHEGGGVPGLAAGTGDGQVRGAGHDPVGLLEELLQLLGALLDAGR